MYTDARPRPQCQWLSRVIGEPGPFGDVHYSFGNNDNWTHVGFIGTNNGFIHLMHIHGGPFEVVARDGETLPSSACFLADVVNVGPGQRYDVIWKARLPGKWLIHCHIPHIFRTTTPK
jgi:hypothetical protein